MSPASDDLRHLPDADLAFALHLPPSGHVGMVPLRDCSAGVTSGSVNASTHDPHERWTGV